MRSPYQPYIAEREEPAEGYECETLPESSESDAHAADTPSERWRLASWHIRVLTGTDILICGNKVVHYDAYGERAEVDIDYLFCQYAKTSGDNQMMWWEAWVAALALTRATTPPAPPEVPPAPPEAPKVQSDNLTPKESTMTASKDSPAFSDLTSALRDGAKDGGAAALASAMTDAFLRTALAKRLPYAVTGTPLGRAALTWVLPVAVYGLTVFAGDTIPKADRIRALALRAIRGYTVIAVHDSIRELSGFFVELIGLDSLFAGPTSPTAEE